MTPDGNAVLVEVDEAPFWGWFDYKADKGDWLENDQPGTIYYPITEDILKAAAAMADAIGHEVWSCDLEGRICRLPRRSRKGGEGVNKGGET
ncbi:MAG: hypothetical protein EBQ89_06910 [Alphaproteobacteria bacterium]|nr:hypothetical protein [Alphaproteobacteria bacterium]